MKSPLEKHPPEFVYGIIKIPGASKAKYEIDKEMPSGIAPIDYEIILQTFVFENYKTLENKRL